MMDRLEEPENAAQAGASGTETSPGTQPTGSRRAGLRLLTLQELRKLPPPEFLVGDLIPQGGLSVLYGPPGEGKTFLALDMALCVSTGRPWHGKAVASASIVYISAEGGAGMAKRAEAWLAEHGLSAADNAHFILVPPQLWQEEGVTELINCLGDLRPKLIVADTLARCFVGGDENDSKDMGLLIDGVGRLQRAFRCAVLLVHHTGKTKQEIERGSSALRGAADAMVVVSKDGRIVTVTNNKQKDATECAPIRLELVPRPVALPDGRVEQSLVLVDPGRTPGAVTAGPVLGVRCYDYLRALDQLSRTKPGQVRRAEIAQLMGGSTSKVDRAREEAVAAGLVEPEPGFAGSYRLTPQGVVIISSTSSRGGDYLEASVVITPTPHRGGGDDKVTTNSPT